MFAEPECGGGGGVVGYACSATADARAYRVGRLRFYADVIGLLQLIGLSPPLSNIPMRVTLLLTSAPFVAYPFRRVNRLLTFAPNAAIPYM